MFMKFETEMCCPCLQESALAEVADMSWGEFKPVLADAVRRHITQTPCLHLMYIKCPLSCHCLTGKSSKCYAVGKRGAAGPFAAF